VTAELLRRAATQLREHAERATEDLAELEVILEPADVAGWDFAMSHLLDHGVGEYCALMHPPVALALAEWLEAVAVGIASLASSVGYQVPLPEDEQAFNLARAILREES
jgi:hypothetical protein